MQLFKMPILLLILFGGGAYLVYQNMTGPGFHNDLIDYSTNAPTNAMNLPDVQPPEQNGNYDQSYDQYFMWARDKFGVPFALLKAHSIRESNLVPSAFLQEPSGKASYGLMQVLWWANSNRFNKYGYSDDMIGDGTLLYDPEVNVNIAAQIILLNWKSCNANLRDTINMYNTGVKESVRQAPNNYVNDVLKYYSGLVGKDVLGV